MKLEDVASLIVAHENFPKDGILFQDIFPIFRNPSALQTLLNDLTDHCRSLKARVDVVVGSVAYDG